MTPQRAEHRPYRSGWCTAAAGAPVVHHACRWDLCQCDECDCKAKNATRNGDQR